jgi:cell division protein FtsQ
MINRRRAAHTGRTRLRRAWLHHIRLSACAAACGIGLAGALWYGAPSALKWVTAHPYFALTQVTVEGNRRLTRDEVLRWAAIDQGMSIWNAAPGLVQMRLQSHPWVQRVTVRREFPHRLLIDVRERHPVAIAQLDQLNYVDRAGRILGPLRDDDSRDFPIITGLDGATTQGFASIAMHRALQLLRWCERMSCLDGVSEVHVDRYRGVTLFPVRPAVPVLLGWGNWRDKLVRLARVFAAWDGQTTRLATVDVSFRNLVVVKLREEPHPAAKRSLKRGLRV